MRHNHVFVLRIFKLLNMCHFWHSVVTPRVFIARAKIFRWKVLEMQIVTHIM